MRTRSLILTTAARGLLPLMIVFSVFLLFRGHNEPGGGFVGGLVASAAFALYGFANGVNQARARLHTQPNVLIGAGLLLAAASGLPSLLLGQPFMTGLWSAAQLPVVGKIGTPLFFDIGVYLLVLGVTTMIMFSLAEEAGA